MGHSLTIGSLFSGVGGLEYGLEKAGFGPVLFQAEIAEYQRTVLKKHWPNAKLFTDVKEVSNVTACKVGVLCGGFPCTDLSSANVVDRSGLNGSNSGLWSEFFRITKELEPEWVIVENAGRTWYDWVPVVRRDLWSIGYASLPVRLSTSISGAPHHRDRVFTVAHSDIQGKPLRALYEKVAGLQTNARPFSGYWEHPFTGPVCLADGIPGGLLRTRAIGNAVCPITSELLGRLILDAIQETNQDAP